jgi:hypothetical protein
MGGLNEFLVRRSIRASRFVSSTDLKAEMGWLGCDPGAD